MVPNSATKAIGTRLRKAREEAQLTQAQLASKIGVTFQAIQQLERGELRWLERLELIATILDVPFEWLLTGRATKLTSKLARADAKLVFYPQSDD